LVKKERARHCGVLPAQEAEKLQQTKQEQIKINKTQNTFAVDRTNKVKNKVFFLKINSGIYILRQVGQG
jgi:hypothetical protein